MREEGLIESALLERSLAYQRAAGYLPLAAARLAERIVDAVTSGGTVYLIGNGGSAALCQHFAAEMVGRFSHIRPGLPVVSLASDTAVMSAITNDHGFDEVFARQIDAQARPGDLVIAFSVSGLTHNIGRAVDTARRKGCGTFLLTGQYNTRLVIANDTLSVQEDSRAIVQEIHLAVLHAVCVLLDAPAEVAMDGT